MALDKVTVGVLADDAVATAKVADDAVTGAKIENNPTVAGNLTVAGTSTLTGNVTVAGDIVPSAPLSNRNLIINGAMQCWQRTTDGVTYVDGTEGYRNVDRWSFNFNSACPGQINVNKETTETPDGFSTAMKIQTNSTATPSSAPDFLEVKTKIEAQDLQHLSFGTSAAKTITLSWYMKSVAYTDPIAIYFESTDNTGQYFTVNKTPTTSWARYSMTLPGNTTSTGKINNDNGIGFNIGIILSAMTSGTYAQADDSTAWATTGKLHQDNQGNFLSSTSNILYLTGFQLELGSNATPFEHRSYGEELIRCQRYCIVFGDGSQGAATCFHTGVASHSDKMYVNYILPVKPRAAPTVSMSGQIILSDNYALDINVTTPTIIDQTNSPNTGGRVRLGNLSNLTVARVYGSAGNAGSGKTTFDAEL